MIAAAVAQRMTDIQTQSKSQESQELQDLSDQQDQVRSTENDRENLSVQFSSIEFFNSFLSDDNSTNNVVLVRKDIFYHYVNLFINKVKTVAVIKDMNIVRQSLTDYF